MPLRTILHENKEIAVDVAFQLALDLLVQSRFPDVAELCRKIVAVDPDHYRAHHGIGICLYKSGNSTEAVKHFHKAIAINPEYFEAYNNLGNLMRESGNLDESLHFFLMGKAIRPDAPMIHSNIGNALRDLDRNAEAIISYQKALRLDPCHMDARYGLAVSLQKLCQHEEAGAEFQKVLRQNPNHVNALYGLATTQKEMGRVKESYDLFKQLLLLKPEMYEALLSLANLLQEQVKFGMEWAQDETLSCYRRIVAVKPDDSATHNTLANLLLSRGEIAEALHEYRQAVALIPHNPILRSCLLMALQYHSSPTLAELYKESTLWPEFCAADIKRKTAFVNTLDSERPLRIGYVSADFKMHPVSSYLRPILYHHDSERYPVFCYSNSKVNDVFTEQLKSYADNWRDIVDLNDQELHNLIVSDNIDILVDLSGHTDGNRLLLFTSKPAPVQVTWIGYFFSTGLKEIDYIFMDETAVLPREEHFFSETVIRLPQTRFCYEPPNAAPDVAPLPALNNNYITFGSFNNLAKMTPEVINLWAKVLITVPNSRLLLKAKSLGSDSVRRRISEQFANQGVSPDRLIFRGASPHIDMLREYGDMDIALDPFPFNGGQTSCEALWMGVPVITLFGNRPIARQTSGFLKTIGLKGFIADNEKEYIELAKKWSSGTEELSQIRSSVRGMMKNSLLCDGKQFTANLEKTYRNIWKKWCSDES